MTELWQEPPAGWSMVLIDGWELRRDGVSVSTTRAVQRLSALLAIQGRRDRTLVASQLWPECNDHHAQGNLRSALWRIRQQHPGLVDAADGALALNPHVCIDVDEIVRHARAVLDEGVALPDALAALAAGDLLPGWYDDWVLQQRERLHQIQLHALERLAALHAQEGRYLEALQAGLTAVRMDPLRESAHRVVARVHLAEGNVGEAIRQFERCRQVLASEFGILPTRQFLDLMGPIRQHPRTVP